MLVSQSLVGIRSKGHRVRSVQREVASDLHAAVAPYLSFVAGPGFRASNASGLRAIKPSRPRSPGKVMRGAATTARRPCFLTISMESW